ncbi:MAG: ClbS/DfsB family four-helix bundle protein [Chloroflexi bacterium]|nr:ClbS/DfsB family four-helix bundle protein [Chloroflexota bacterium]
METREVLLERLNDTLTQLLGVVRTLPNPDRVVSDDWTVKDMLSHVTFWHESFARNVDDLANGRKPTPLKGKLADLNQRGVDELRGCTLNEVIARLEAAHGLIQANVLNPAISLIPYRKGSRDYSPEEHLDIVNKHIEQHLKGIQAALK